MAKRSKCSIDDTRREGKLVYELVHLVTNRLGKGPLFDSGLDVASLHDFNGQVHGVSRGTAERDMNRCELANPRILHLCERVDVFVCVCV